MVDVASRFVIGGGNLLLTFCLTWVSVHRIAIALTGLIPMAITDLEIVGGQQLQSRPETGETAIT
jgi:hypothetical protein